MYKVIDDRWQIAQDKRILFVERVYNVCLFLPVIVGPARVDHRGRPVMERASEFTARVSPMVGPQQSQQVGDTNIIPLIIKN